MHSVAQYDLADTIVAIGSAPGGAARGLVRMSGPRAMATLAAAFRPREGDLSIADLQRTAVVAGDFLLAQFAGRTEPTPVPATAYLWPHARSYTRQPLAELHLPGSPPVLAGVAATLCKHGARPAAPGEFTLRAFLSGRIDLTQAEAVLGVIDAGQRRDLEIALTQLAGGLRNRLSELRDGLLDLLAHLEAGLDFVEEDLEFIAASQLTAQLAAAQAEVDSIASQLDQREQSGAGGLRVVLSGEPNVGKSSLFNALAGAGAIVSPVPGTTRDWLTARLSLGGLECQLIDTPGRETPADDRTMQSAQAARREQLQGAHLTLLCLDATRELTEWEQAELARSAEGPRLVVLTKCDGASSQRDTVALGTQAIRTSSHTGQGLDELRAAIRAAGATVDATAGGVVPLTAARARHSLAQVQAALASALALAVSRGGDELIAAEIRGALDGLGQIVGAVYTEDLLDRIFSRFCIGK